MPRTSRGLALRAELKGKELAEKGSASSEVLDRGLVAVGELVEAECLWL